MPEGARAKAQRPEETKVTHHELLQFFCSYQGATREAPAL